MWEKVVGKIQQKHACRRAFLSAERQGFEPWEQLPVHRISSAARSTTPASFRCKNNKIWIQRTVFLKIIFLMLKNTIFATVKRKIRI